MKSLEQDTAIHGREFREGAGCVAPDNTEANFNRGIAHFEWSEVEEAVASFTEALRCNPDFVPAYNNRAVAHHALGNHKQAIADLDQAVRLDPDCHRAYRNRMEIYEELGDDEQALADRRIFEEKRSLYTGAGVEKWPECRWLLVNDPAWLGPMLSLSYGARDFWDYVVWGQVCEDYGVLSLPQLAVPMIRIALQMLLWHYPDGALPEVVNSIRQILDKLEEEIGEDLDKPLVDPGTALRG